jgi:mRNA-capping enzyme
MAFSMDLNLNASPVPDEDEQQPYEEVAEVEYAQEEHVESAVTTMRRVHGSLSI